MQSLVSIIMPSYNTAKFIGASIESVLKQTYANWELIIVDDCSTDDTDAIVALYDDERIQYYKNEENRGAALTRNKALQKARGKWVAFLDSDDLWMPEKLERQVEFMEKNEFHFSYTKYVEIDEQGEDLGVLVTGPKKISKFRMYMFNYMGCLTVMYDRDYVGIIQINDLKKRNDYAIWIKVVNKSPAYLCDELLAKYRVRSEGSIMNRKKNPLGRMKYNFFLWTQGENMNCICACCLTGINLLFGMLKKVIYRKKQ